MFLGQVKINKADTPLRLIVASRGGPTYNWNRKLAKILHSLVGNTKNNIKNSDQFTSFIQKLMRQPGEIMDSFNVVSLFTNVLSSKAATIPKNRLQADPNLKDCIDLTQEKRL